jgi:nitrate reductase delta subunit
MNLSLTLEALAPLLEYPTKDYHMLAEACAASIDDKDLETISGGQTVSRHVATFVEKVKKLSIEEVEELYTRTFDLNPTCSLDIGWHLYGEQYARGNFLVTLREALRNHGIDEETELPDHLPSVLRLVARSGEEESSDLAGSKVHPALTKMLTAFKDENNPYASLLLSVQGILGMISPQEIGEEDHD